MEMNIKCDNCGVFLNEDPSESSEKRKPCPNCGSKGRIFTGVVNEPVTIKETIDLSKIRQFFMFNRRAIVGLVVITLASPFVCSILPGLLGVLVSFLLGVIGIVVGCFAILRIREIERYIGK